MFTSEAAMAGARGKSEMALPSRQSIGIMRTESSIVPRNTIAGRALVAVIAIMTFLAALTGGGVMLIVGSAMEWQSEVAREMTIQVRPVVGRDTDAEVARAAQIAQNTAGIADVRIYTKDESARLLEPWLGSGLALDDLPVPRIVVVRLKSGQQPDVSGLRNALTRQVAGASLDDHRGWVGRMRTMAGSAVAIGLIVLALVLTATVLSVAFATRGAMAANRPIIEVLHLIGATDRFIASQFQRHFLGLALRGGAYGGGAAVLLFLLAGFISDRLVGTAAGDEVAALFGSFSIGFLGYAIILAEVVLIAAITVLASRQIVNRTLRTVG